MVGFLVHRTPRLGQFETLIDDPHAIIPQFNKVNPAIWKDAIIQADAENRCVGWILVPDGDSTEEVAPTRISTHERQSCFPRPFPIRHLHKNPERQLDWEGSRAMDPAESCS